MSEARQQVRIRSAADLFESLRHPEASVRLPTLAAVAAQPELTLAYGPHQGVDVIGELCQQLDRDQGLFAKVIFSALLAFQDERVVSACGRVLQARRDPDLLSLACQRLAKESSESARRALQEMLFAQDPARATIAARALSSRQDLSLVEKIHVDLWVGLEDSEIQHPRSRPVWLELLAGPLQDRARRCLENQGLDTFAWLATVQPGCSWLLTWGCREFPELVEPLLEQALKSREAVVALKLLADYPQRFLSLRPATRGFLQDPDPARRELAWRVAPLDSAFCWKQSWQEEEVPEVRLAQAVRLSRQCQDEEFLLTLAHSDDWRFRSLASQGLIRLGAQEAARRLALSPKVELRTVGASVLLAMEDYEWMEEHLM
ncbi:hypothetical protein JST97_14520 [bacterium]|nr:hypothetical protein [bacterium]